MGSNVANQKSHTFTILQDYGLQVTDYRLSEEIKQKELLHKITSEALSQHCEKQQKQKYNLHVAGSHVLSNPWT